VSTDPAKPRRRSGRLHRGAGALGLALALAAFGTAWSVVAPRGATTEAGSDPKNTFTAQDLALGKRLFATGCASCHGAAGQGGKDAQAPSLIGVGAAAVDFQVSTGRMPLKEIGAQAERHQPQYNPEQIHALAGYVASFGPGPEIPTVDPAAGDLALGATLFRGNCANCHNFAGQGGALSGGKYAPALSAATPQQLADAVRTGPESMPVFSPAQLSDAEVNSIAAYVEFLRTTPDPGGHGIGRLGPVPEGLVVWIVGIGGLAGFCLWIGKRSPRLSRTTAHATAEGHHR
jgi:ubiquinol-cytochrome c reductase cytochrome c subunit